MPKRIGVRLPVLVTLMLMICALPLANAASVRTFLTFRVTTRTQSAVVNIGQDLQIEVGVDGVTPSKWQWYFNEAPIAQDGNERVYNLVNAKLEDAGIYRMEAYDEQSRLLVSIDVNVRVIDPYALPESGDDSLPVSVAFFALGAGVLIMTLALVKRARRV